MCLHVLTGSCIQTITSVENNYHFIKGQLACSLWYSSAFSASMHELNGAGICAAACSLTNLTTQYHSLFLAPIPSSFQVDSIYMFQLSCVQLFLLSWKIWLRLSPEHTPKEHQRTTKPVWLAALAGSAQGSSISPRFQNVFKPLLNRALVEHYVSKQFKSGK